jgi:hypothetical protein
MQSSASAEASEYVCMYMEKSAPKPSGCDLILVIVKQTDLMLCRARILARMEHLGDPLAKLGYTLSPAPTAWYDCISKRSEW